MRENKGTIAEPNFGSSFVVAWTGHRRLSNESVVARAVKSVIELLKLELNDRLVGIGSIAIGADTIVAETLISRGVPLSVVLPFEIQRFERDAPDAERQRVLSLYDSARSVRHISLQPNDDDAYLAASEMMLEHADLLIAVINPDEPATRVGSKAVVDLADKLGIQIITIDARTGDFSFMKTVNSDKCAPIRTRADVVEYFQYFDAAADLASKPVRSILFWIIFLHLAASAIAVAQLVFEEMFETHLDSYAASVIKIGGLACALGLAWRGRSRHYAWTHARVGAEMCRSFLAIWDMPRNSVMLPPAPTPESSHLRRELELAWLLNTPSQKNLEGVRSAYIMREPPEVTDPANANGRVMEQIKYFMRHRRRASDVGHKLERVASTSTIVAIAAGIGAFVFLVMHHEGGTYLTLKAMSLCLPLVSAALLSYVTSLDLGRRASRYQEMEKKCEESLKRCEAAETWHSLGRAVSELEWLFLAEVGEWHAFNRHAGALH